MHALYSIGSSIAIAAFVGMCVHEFLGALLAGVAHAVTHLPIVN